LSADEIAIYKAVLEKYGDKDTGNLNVSRTTYPLNLDAFASGLKSPDCLGEIQLENLSVVAHSFHDLPPEVLTGSSMKLVDPKQQAKIVHSNDPSRTIRNGTPVDNAVRGAFATALFSMSEIAFDKDHHFAAVSYAFWCGSLCGNGSTMIFEKVDGTWKNTNRNCGHWVS